MSWARYTTVIAQTNTALLQPISPPALSRTLAAPTCRTTETPVHIHNSRNKIIARTYQLSETPGCLTLGRRLPEVPHINLGDHVPPALLGAASLRPIWHLHTTRLAPVGLSLGSSPLLRRLARHLGEILIPLVELDVDLQ